MAGKGSRYGKRLNKRRWAAARLAALRRDGYQCVKCQKIGRLEVDHVQPLHRGGAEYDLENLQALCRECHFQKTADDMGHDTPGRKRWRELVDALE